MIQIHLNTQYLIVRGIKRNLAGCSGRTQTGDPTPTRTIERSRARAGIYAAKVVRAASSLYLFKRLFEVGFQPEQCERDAFRSY